MLEPVDSPELPIREPAVAGYFYPGDARELRAEIDDFLRAVPRRELPGRILGLISPHAGYPYSGPVAAHGYAQLVGRKIRRCVVVAPSHVEAFPGASVFPGRAYRTPLGEIPVDVEFCRRLAESGGARLSNHGHFSGRGGRGEHSLEVQLPFLQVTLGEFHLVPVVVGRQDMRTSCRLGLALGELMDEETLVVASSDLSHYHPDEQARRLDRKVADAVAAWDYYSLHQLVELGEAEACGTGPIVAAMIAAQRIGGNCAKVLHYGTSGDVPSGRRDAVVGYLSAALLLDESAPEIALPELDIDEIRSLFDLARRAVERAVLGGVPVASSERVSSALQRPAAVFVTLREGGHLRGCIGSTVARVPLYQAVTQSAASAAMQDPRFIPVRLDELAVLEYEISILSPLRLIVSPEEIEIGRDGLMVELDGYRGLLLPQVAVEHGWDRDTFLAQTCIKAGLPPDAWRDPDAVLWAFSALVLEEPDRS
ncbi:MAG TPA: AmmeMemoRadiSam system protein B [Acidobacteriota bacterium]|nr:AmmeMemoRadiSam system protein B [Acidobacteriota bacterium]